jgi:hypothetical protein
MRTFRDFFFFFLALELTAIIHGSFSLFWFREVFHILKLVLKDGFLKRIWIIEIGHLLIKIVLFFIYFKKDRMAPSYAIDFFAKGRMAPNYTINLSPKVEWLRVTPLIFWLQGW